MRNHKLGSRAVLAASGTVLIAAAWLVSGVRFRVEDPRSTPPLRLNDVRRQIRDIHPGMPEPVLRQKLQVQGRMPYSGGTLWLRQENYTVGDSHYLSLTFRRSEDGSSLVEAELVQLPLK